MRLTRWKQEEWTRFAPYVDTLCLPAYRIRIYGKRPELDEAKRIRTVAEAVERELTGRLLLLPGIPYTGSDPHVWVQYLNRVVEDLAESAFHHLFILAPEGLLSKDDVEATSPLSVFLLEVPSVGEPEDCAAELCSQVIRRWESNFRE